MAIQAGIPEQGDQLDPPSSLGSQVWETLSREWIDGCSSIATYQCFGTYLRREERGEKNNFLSSKYIYADSVGAVHIQYVCSGRATY